MALLGSMMMSRDAIADVIPVIRRRTETIGAKAASYDSSTTRPQSKRVSGIALPTTCSPASVK